MKPLSPEENKDYQFFLEYRHIEDCKASMAEYLTGVSRYEEAREIYTSLGRDNVTDNHMYFHPSLLTAREFIHQLTESAEAFTENMEHLKFDKMYAEQWLQVFARWLDMDVSVKVENTPCKEWKE